MKYRRPCAQGSWTHPEEGLPAFWSLLGSQEKPLGREALCHQSFAPVLCHLESKAYNHERENQRKEGSKSGMGVGGGQVEETPTPTSLRELYTPRVELGELEEHASVQ